MKIQETIILNHSIARLPESISAADLVKNIFAMALENSDPIEVYTPIEWKNRWLDSKVFTRVLINPAKVASPFMNTQHKIRQLRAASAEVIKRLPPVIVDINKRNVGDSPSGYVPKIIVIYGSERHLLHQMNSANELEAWVGDKALAYLGLNSVKLNIKSNSKPLAGMEAAIAIANVPSKTNVVRQDRPDEKGSAPHKPMAKTGGDHYINLSSSRRVKAAVANPSPGSGVGPRVAPSKGASHSEVSTINFAGTYVGSLWTRFKSASKNGYKPKLEAKAPPGWEGVVKHMKKHPEITNPYALSYWMKDQGYTPKKAMMACFKSGK